MLTKLVEESKLQIKVQIFGLFRHFALFEICGRQASFVAAKTTPYFSDRRQRMTFTVPIFFENFDLCFENFDLFSII